MLVLASRSPRRARLLREAGYLIDVVPADVDERRLEEEAPRTYVARLAAAASSSAWRRGFVALAFHDRLDNHHTLSNNRGRG